MSEIVLAAASRQLELLGARKILVTELAEEHIRQIERLNPALNALVDFDPDRVRAQAKQLDLAPETRGPLHGLPVTIKSSIATAGYRCEIGSFLHEGEIPKKDAELVARLRAAGALILGTTNCPELLMAYETANLLHGQTRNPWDLERTPGGSSGGESAAIAAGLSAAGFGSAATCRPAWAHSRSLVSSDRWRAPWLTSRCSFEHSADRIGSIPSALRSPCASLRSTICGRTQSASSKMMAWRR